MSDVTDASFQTAVLDRSHQVPVVVDLWAEWCGPCKQLGPILEKVIAETNGAVELAKVDVDANRAVAQAFNVQSIPAVFAMKDGQIVDQFLGAQGEGQVREFVQRLAGAAEPTEVERLLSLGDEASLTAALELEPANDAVIIAMAALLISSDRGEEATALLARIPETPEVRHLLALARTDTAEIGDVEATLAELLLTVKTDDDARQRFVDLLEVMGPGDPRVGEWRRRLSTALF